MQLLVSVYAPTIDRHTNNINVAYIKHCSDGNIAVYPVGRYMNGCWHTKYEAITEIHKIHADGTKDSFFYTAGERGLAIAMLKYIGRFEMSTFKGKLGNLLNTWNQDNQSYRQELARQNLARTTNSAAAYELRLELAKATEQLLDFLIENKQNSHAWYSGVAKCLQMCAIFLATRTNNHHSEANGIHDVVEGKRNQLISIQADEIKPTPLDDMISDLLKQSKTYSRKFKVVVSRDGSGSAPDHYEVHSPFLKMDADDQWAVKEFMPDYEEFLMDEDGKFMENDQREVSVREVRLGKKVAKMDIVQEPVFRMVKEV